MTVRAKPRGATVSTDDLQSQAPAMMSPDEILRLTDHRPWPLPQLPWVMSQQWSDLLFAHWALPPAVVRSLVPEAFELDLHDGMAWVSVTPFRMTHIQVRGLPPIPGANRFLEMNLRTYVRLPHRGSFVASNAHGVPGSEPADDQTKPGVYFFSLDASNLPAVLGARLGLGLPYFWSEMSAAQEGDTIHYSSHRRESNARVEVAYTPGDIIGAPTALDRFLTERYCLYEMRLGVPIRTQIQHARWPLQHAKAKFAVNTVGESHRLPLTTTPDVTQFSRRLDVLIYPPE